MPETFTESTTITTVNTAPVTITSIDTYETMVDGHEETKTITETDYYSNTSELPCYDRHLSRHWDSGTGVYASDPWTTVNQWLNDRAKGENPWDDNESIVPPTVESWAPIGQWENGKAFSQPSN